MMIIGYDPGYGNSKAACLDASGRLQTYHLPSVVGVGNTELGLLDSALGCRRRRDEMPDETTFDQVTYLVGKNVANYARPVERMDFMRLSDGPELKALFLTTLHHLLGDGQHHDIRVMIGLPVEVMQDRKLALSIRRDLRKWMIDQHDVTVNGTLCLLDITRVEVMPQPAGSYFNWGMDDAGKWCKGASTLKDTIAICDCGFNTVDLFVLKAGNIVARYTNGSTLGMRRAAELITDHIRQDHGVSLSLHEADAFLHQKQPELSTANGLIDLTALVNQARETVAAGVLQFTERQWGNARRFRHVLFTGGGAEILRDQLARAYPHGHVVASAVTANAAGLAKYGLRPLSK